MRARLHIPVRSAISNYVTAIWETMPPGALHELILPKGVVEIVFNLSDPMMGILPHQDTRVVAPVCFLQGLNTHVVDVQYSGEQHLLGICLQPDMVRSLLGIIPSECKDSLIDIRLLQPSYQALWQALKEAASFTERVAILEQRLPLIDTSNCSRTRHFCNLFSDHTETVLTSMDMLSKEVCYSSRQLNRKAKDLFGVTAEELLAHKRFRTSISLMHSGKRSLTDIAYEAGFYDQAHFCRTFKQFAGFTAREYQQRKSEQPFHLFS